LVARARNVYAVYQQRADAFAAARKLLPPDTSVVGLVTFDDPETSLWRPFFHRRIEHVTVDDTLESLRLRGIDYVLVNPDRTVFLFGQKLEEWLARMGGTIAGRVTLPLRASSGPSEWLLVRM